MLTASAFRGRLARSGWSVRLRRVLLSLAGVAVVLLGGGVAGGQITLDQDFETGSLNVAGSTVVGNTVLLEPRRWNGQHWWIYFRVSGVAGLTPEFQVPMVTPFRRYSAPYLYSYDGVQWSLFDFAISSSFGQYYKTGNLRPFTQDQVYVAYGLPYTVSQLHEHVASVRSSPFVSPTAGSNAELILGQSAGGVDDTGRVVPRQPLYGYRITDPSAGGGKQKVVMTAGTHSGEQTGNYTLQGVVDFLVSSDPAAAALRRAAEFYVYPMVDPDGRYGGYFRGNPEAPALDHNRHWNDPAGLTDVSQIAAAILADTGGEADIFLDFHSASWSGSLGLVYDERTADIDAFAADMRAREPRFTVLQGGFDPPGAAAVWAATAEGLGAEFSVTPETGFITGWRAERYSLLGENYARSLAAIIPEPTALAVLSLGAGPLLRRARRRRR